MKNKNIRPQSERVIRMPEVEERTGMSRSSVYNMMNDGRFPKSVKLSLRAVGWRSSDVDAWLSSRTEAA